MDQLVLNTIPPQINVTLDYEARLRQLLADDLDFHGQNNTYSVHNLHAFPAKFPPQLPHKFIEALTNPGDIVLDPMMGSGTTLIEAFYAGRQAIGFDIDPLAALLTRVKTLNLDVDRLTTAGHLIVERATNAGEDREALAEELAIRWDTKTKAFIDYWFAPDTQLELLALIQAIEQMSATPLREYFLIVFGSLGIRVDTPICGGKIQYQFGPVQQANRETKWLISNSR
ncbi:DNA methyltransferase [Chloroflexota bacterium]